MTIVIYGYIFEVHKDRIPNLLLLLLQRSIETEEEKPNILMAATFRIPCQIKEEVNNAHTHTHTHTSI